MRYDFRDKNISLKDFKKVYGDNYNDRHESIRERDIIRDWEKATGQKYDGEIKRPSKKGKSSGEKLGKTKE